WKAAEWKHAPGGGTVSGAAVPGPPVEPPYVLYVGTAKPHKNLTTLLRAHAANAALPPLVLAGPTGAEVEGTVVPAGGASGGGLSAASVGSRVRPLGRVPDAWLPTLYRGAAALAIPSRYEGVGLAALEAMSFGVPVVAADSPGLADTVGDAAVLVPTTDIGAWSDALAKVAGGGSLPWREVLTERGRQHVAGRRWDDVAAEYVRVYEAAAARVPRQ
ncbi:MAG TPA: glycosyltransferase, partial [Acidimicrobiales bacterium]|nr:glycosyltransferase [Acidimicrobiales bacterium]